MFKYIILILLTFIFITTAEAEIYLCTAYCPCHICTGKYPHHKAYGITASGIKAYKGIIACNHYDFGKLLDIEGIGVVSVQDRGSKKHFGTMKRIVKHIDVFLPTHQDALNFGVKYLNIQEVKL